MKKLFLLFGFLDIITLIRSYEHLIPSLQEWIDFPLMTVASSLLYASLIFSAYFSLRQQKMGLWITYFQFPFRMAFLVLSFGVLLMISPLLNNPTNYYRIMIWVLVGLEILRLIFSIVMYRNKFFSKNEYKA
jgi:hypothetical protein